MDMDWSERRAIAATTPPRSQSPNRPSPKRRSDTRSAASVDDPYTLAQRSRAWISSEAASVQSVMHGCERAVSGHWDMCAKLPIRARVPLWLVDARDDLRIPPSASTSPLIAPWAIW